MFGARGKQLFIIAFFALGCWSAPAWAIGGGGNETGNGGVGIQIGGAVKVFDKVEYDEPLIPKKTGKVWSTIDARLQALSAKMPSTGMYLRGFFDNGKIVWYFVNATLKPTHDEGGTNLLITYRREQIAAHSGMIVQIRKDIWDTLDDDEKATLLVHEMLWSALGTNYVGDGSIIRRLSRYLLRPDLADFSTENVADFLIQTLSMAQPPGSAADSPLLNYIFYDRTAAQTAQPFAFSTTPSGAGDQVVATVVGASLIQGMRVTPLRPNSAYPSVSWSHYARTFSNGQTGSALAVGELCSTLNYGGSQKWRLPSRSELAELKRLGILSQKYWGGYFWPVDSQSAGVPMASSYSDVPAQPKLVIDSSQTLKCFEEDFASCGMLTLYDPVNIPYFCVEGPAVRHVAAGQVLTGTTYFMYGNYSPLNPPFGGSLIDQDICGTQKSKWSSQLRNANLLSLNCMIDGKEGDAGGRVFLFAVGEMTFSVQSQKPLSAYSIHVALPDYELIRQAAFTTYGQDYDAAYSQYGSRFDFVMETWDRPDGYVPPDVVGQVWLTP